MKLDESVWSLIPDFSGQLSAAMDRAGMSAREVAEALQQLGFGTSRNQINRLVAGELDRTTGQRRRSNPTLILLAGLTEVLEVPPAWWFERSPEVLAAQMERFYSERSRKRTS
ncbi:helix-turn-helix domain-containing protein [Flexivirga meconopsidis]|uniref:helix-turn-helix domain-containing protein n=1 Tax=Flexivirga meconopsidis TaxID=2977121 RepID=UPI0022406116|nr:helix-turn-helix transcriptional regulator [Flexivirga meconopsidis]